MYPDHNPEDNLASRRRNYAALVGHCTLMALRDHRKAAADMAADKSLESVVADSTLSFGIG